MKIIDVKDDGRSQKFSVLYKKDTSHEHSIVRVRIIHSFTQHTITIQIRPFTVAIYENILISNSFTSSTSIHPSIPLADIYLSPPSDFHFPFIMLRRINIDWLVIVASSPFFHLK